MTDTTITRRGLMLVLSSPSGAGKTTISRRLLAENPNLVLSISATTRPKRPAEAEGKDYYFISPERFQGMVRGGEFLEHATVFGHAYGTPLAPVEANLCNGQDVLFDIDWQGTQQVAEKAPNDLVRVFILPPSTEELERRLKARAQDSDDVVRGRMAKAADEMSHYAEYDYIVVNRDVERSVAEVQAILTAEQLKQSRQTGLRNFVERLRRRG